MFQGLSKSKFLSFMTNVNPSNEKGTKSGIFLWDVFNSDVISFKYQKILKYFNGFQNQNFSVLSIN